MNRSSKNIFIGSVVVAVLVLVGAGFYYSKQAAVPGKYDAFAQCIADSGAIFYGAFWCPHCQNQKAMFGKSAKLLPYVECSTANGRGQLEVCKDAGVTGYPTWVFADESRLGGEVSFETLAEKTGCTPPIE